MFYKRFFALRVCTPLKAKTEENYKIFYAKFMEPDPSKFDIYEVLKIFAMITDHWLLKMGNMEGLLFILDFKGVTWGHVPRIGINPIRKLVTYVQVCFIIFLFGFVIIFICFPAFRTLFPCVWREYILSTPTLLLINCCTSLGLSWRRNCEAL